MQKTMKKTLSIILAILMIVTTVPFAFAAEGETRTIYVKEEVTGFNFGYEYWFVDADGNDLNCTYEDLGDNWYKYTVPVSAAKYYMWKGIGGGDSYPYEPIPEKVDTLINRNGEAEWYCSHQMNTSGEHNCKGFLCEICGETYGEADLSAHKIKDGICEVCGEADPDAPLIIDVTDKNVVGLGEGARFYDEDGYIITGTNENCDINVYESSNITLRNLSAKSMRINSPDGAFITIKLEGINELAEDLSLYKDHIIFEGSDDAVFKADCIYNGGNSEASVTLNGGNIVLEAVSYNNYTVYCGKLIINGGTLTASNDSDAVIGSSVKLNGGELNIISTSQQFTAIWEKITMKKGALLTVSAESGILSYSAEITVADELAESDNFFVRYDTESEFVPVQDIEEALDGKTYAEIKVDTHVHSYEDSNWSYSTEKHWKKCSCGEIAEEAAHTYTDSKCECGYSCYHPGQTGNTCEYCGAAIHTCDFSGEWKYDVEKHWKECSCGEISAEATHTYIDGVCECGYACEHESYTGGKCDICGFDCLHENVTDGKCDVCGAEVKDITITMTDSYGDGWSNNAIQVGFVSEGVFTKIADATIDDGANATYETVISDGEVVAFRWTKGDYPDECSFTISVDGEIIFEKSDCSDFADNEFIYIDCNHNYTDSVCSICGLTCGVDFSHKMNGGTECNACGFVCNHNYTNHYCKACSQFEDGYYAGACGANDVNDVIWSLDSEGTLIISGEGEYDITYCDAPWKAYGENIKNVVIEEGITNVASNSFDELPNAVTLSIPSTVASIDPFYNNGFAEIKVAGGNNYYSVIDGVLFNYDKTELIMYPAKKADETYTVPDGVTILGSHAFYLSENLKTVNISDDVTTIEAYCFNCASIENINFGKNVEVVEYNAFLSTGLKTMVLPEKLTEISLNLLYACYSLETLVIGSKVTSIDSSVIQYCNKLKTVHFTGTEEQWQAITKPDNSADKINTIEVHCGALEEKEANDATCTEVGHTAGLYCDECNAYITGEEIPATGNHTYVDGKCECGDECKHPGQTGATCEICGSALHVCDFSGEWNYSDEDHWKECSCGEISAEAEHTFTDGKCDCGYVCDHAGQTGICTICGMTLHVCDFSGEWQYDSEKHWKECTCGETSEEAEHTYTDGKCDCGFECPHEETYNNIIRPVQNADGTWGKGTVETICNICTKVTATKEVERADYTAADAAVAELKELLETEDLLDAMKNIYTKRLNISLSIIGDDKIESEQNYIDDITQGINKSIDEIKEGLKDGTMVKADFTYMGSLLDEVKSLTDNNPDSVLIPSMVEIYIVCNNIYNGFANDSSLSQSYYDEKIKEAGFEAQLEALIEAIKDGTAVKVDGFTVYNERGREWLLKFADEGIFEKARELILNSTEVKAKMDEIYDFALSLEGNVAENAENIAKIEADVDEFFGQLKKCIYGIHNVSQYKEISPAKCGENAVESATCTLCGETVTREVENSALTHSFTKYEETEAPKCGVEGKEVAYCDHGCGETDEKAIEALKHSFTKYEVTEEAKCGVEGKEVAYCDNGCGETDEKAIEALKHSFTKYEVTEEAKCGVEGKEVATCDNGCGATDEKAIAALTHKDADGDYKCDNGCGHEFEKPAPEEPTDKACDHLCHKGGFMGFIWKIVKFFWKLFRMNPVCECGVAHY